MSIQQRDSNVIDDATLCLVLHYQSNAPIAIIIGLPYVQ